MESKLLATKEAAKFLGIAAPTLHLWRNQYYDKHPIPYIKIGKFIKYRQEDLEEFLRKNIQNGPSKQ